jgi:hypothetical protein
MAEETTKPTSSTQIRNQTRKSLLKRFKNDVTRETGLRYFAQFLEGLTEATPLLTEGTSVLVATDTNPSQYEAEITHQSAEEFEYGGKEWRENLTLGDIAQLIDEGVEFLEQYYANYLVTFADGSAEPLKVTVNQALDATSLEQFPNHSLISLAERGSDSISEDVLFSNRSRIWDTAQELLEITEALLVAEAAEKTTESGAGSQAESKPYNFALSPGQRQPGVQQEGGPTATESGGEGGGAGAGGESEPAQPLDLKDADTRREFKHQVAWLQGNLLFTYFTAQGLAYDPTLSGEMSTVIIAHLQDLSVTHPERVAELLNYPSPLTRLRLLAEIRQKLLTNNKFVVGYSQVLGKTFEAAGTTATPEQIRIAINAIGVNNQGIIPAQIQLAQALNQQLGTQIPETFALTAQDTIDALIVAEGDINGFLNAHRLDELEIIFFGKKIQLKDEQKFKNLIRQYFVTRKAEHEMFLNRDIRNPLLDSNANLDAAQKRRKADRVSSMRQTFQGFHAKGYQNEETLGALTTANGAAVPGEDDSESAAKIATLRSSLIQSFVATMSISEKRQLYQTYAGYVSTGNFTQVPDELAMVDVLRGEGGLYTQPEFQELPEESSALAIPGQEETAGARAKAQPSVAKKVGGKIANKALNNPLVDKAFDFAAARAVDAFAPGAGAIAVKTLKVVSPELYQTIKKVVVVGGAAMVGMGALAAAMLMAPFVLAIQFGQTVLGALGGGVSGIGSAIGSAVSSVGSGIGNFLGIGGGSTSVGGSAAGAGGLGAGAGAGGAGAGGVGGGAGVPPGAAGAGGSGWGIGAMANPYAIAGTAVGVAGVGSIVISSAIYSAFLYPLPLPTISEDGNVSPYVEIQKVSVQGTEFAAPSDITYRIRIKAKSGFLIQPSATKPPTDVFSVVSANSSSSTVPASSEYQAFLASLATFSSVNSSINDTDWVDVGSYTIPFGSDPSSGTFVDSNVSNQFTMFFTVSNADGRPIPGVSGEIEAFSAEVICFGNCPQNQGGCWPTTGYIKQRPFGTYSHGEADAYDIANNVGTKIYTPWDGRAVALYDEDAPGGGFGNYVKVERTSPTGGKEYFFFGHMNNQADNLSRNWSPVSAGDIIGYMGSTGYSTGNHLHYEMGNSSGGADESSLTFDTSRLRERVPQPNVTISAPGNFVRSCYD